MNINCQFPDDIVAIGTKVFIPRPALKSVIEDEITGYYCTLEYIDNSLFIIPTDYRLTTANVARGSLTNGWKENEFFLSYEEAMSMAVEYPVLATPDEWYKAIGLSGYDEEERTLFDEECELGICCADISAIRDILYNVCLTEKIDGVTRRSLIELIEEHEPPVNKPNLDKILKQLDIEWKD